MNWPSDAELSKLHPELQEVRFQTSTHCRPLTTEELFAHRGFPKLPLPTRANLAQFRKNYNRVIARYNAGPLAKKFLPSHHTAEQDVEVSVRDGAIIKVRIYTPSHVPVNGAPVAVVIHGGGWYMGDLETEATLCRILCHHLGLLVVDVDYRLYPEVDFPAPVTDVYDAVKWV